MSPSPRSLSIVAKMSRLTAYYDWVKIILESLSGSRPNNVETLRFRQDLVPLPLYSIEQVNGMLNFYRNRLNQIESTNVAPRRKLHHHRLCQETARAFKAVYKKEPCDVGIEHFTTALHHVQAALESTIKLRDHDDSIPISQSELFLAADDLQAQRYWFRFKLDSLWPCLLLLVHLFKLMLPDYYEFWEEAEESLWIKDWHSQFICDSMKSQDNGLPEHPRRSDVLWNTSPNGQAK